MSQIQKHYQAEHNPTFTDAMGPGVDVGGPLAELHKPRNIKVKQIGEAVIKIEVFVNESVDVGGPLAESHQAYTVPVEDIETGHITKR